MQPFSVNKKIAAALESLPHPSSQNEIAAAAANRGK